MSDADTTTARVPLQTAAPSTGRYTNPSGSDEAATRAYVQSLLELLGDRDPLDVMAETPSALDDLSRPLDDARLRRPESAGKWSVLEVLAHLADSEVVWSYRLRMVLAQERPPITGYDQDAWARRLGYGEADRDECLERFRLLREGNLRLLRRCSADDLQRVGVHQERGAESLAHLVKLYAAHDLVHRRQIERIVRAV